MIPLAFDGGWSDGDPGAGRLRFDSPRLSDIKHFHISSRDAAAARIGPQVSTWGIGDVIVLERTGQEQNRVVAWVIGEVVNRGTYYTVPVSLRSAVGSFAEHDSLTVSHQLNVPAVPEAPPEPVAPTLVLRPEPVPAQSQPNPELDRLRAENAALMAILNDLTKDQTQVLLPHD